jgi:MFS transporter, DHA1 family, multidrug resistance protein
MNQRQFLTLFAGNFAVFFTGMGLMPLLPLYATTLGASPTLVGIYFALIFGANALGPVAVGWLSSRLPVRTLFLAAGISGVPALALLPAAATLRQAIALTAVVWFAGGISLTVVSIFVGLQTSEANRGRWFSRLAVAAPLGALFGSLVVGQIVARYGFAAAFFLLAAVWAILPTIGMWYLPPERETPTSGKAQRSRAAMPGTGIPFRPGQAFYLLLAACFVGALALNVGQLGTPLSMQALAFSTTAIASTATVSGLVTIPVVLFIGVLADRWGREKSLMAAYLLAAVGIGLLIVAGRLWHFWLAATLLMVAANASGATATALAADLLPPNMLSRGLPWIGVMGSGAGILSFAAAGAVIEYLGPTILFSVGAFVAVIATMQLNWLPGRAAASDTRPLAGTPPLAKARALWQRHQAHHNA